MTCADELVEKDGRRNKNKLRALNDSGSISNRKISISGSQACVSNPLKQPGDRYPQHDMSRREKDRGPSLRMP
jgi:hypothetical protein